MVDIPGKTLEPATAEFLRRSASAPCACSARTWAPRPRCVRLIQDLRALMGPTALICLDQEGGSVVRSTFLPQAPSAMALGASGGDELAESVGAAVARGLKSLGVNWNFAPVVDVNNNPANPVIAERAFSDDPTPWPAWPAHGCAARCERAWPAASSTSPAMATRTSTRTWLAHGRQVACRARRAGTASVQGPVRYRPGGDDGAHRVPPDRPRAPGHAEPQGAQGHPARRVGLRRGGHHRRADDEGHRRALRLHPRARHGPRGGGRPGAGPRQLD